MLAGKVDMAASCRPRVDETHCCTVNTCMCVCVCARTHVCVCNHAWYVSASLTIVLLLYLALCQLVSVANYPMLNFSSSPLPDTICSINKQQLIAQGNVHDRESTSIHVHTGYQCTLTHTVCLLAHSIIDCKMWFALSARLLYIIYGSGF